MEALVVLAFGLVVLALVSPVLAIVALVRASRLEARIRELEADVRSLRRGAPATAPRPIERPAAPAPPRPAALDIPAGVATPEPPSPAAPLPEPASSAARVTPPKPPPPRRPAPPPPDFATSVGPRILIAVGALAVVVALGFFVKLAWENDWVGPTGRVLLGALLGVGLVAAGARLMGREYRPLGQGLAGAGLATLYLSAFGAHAFYGLIGRTPSGILLALITVNAVVLAVRLEARLLAVLAWVGAYLTPVLLSTGEDRALALFVYLALLAAGALALERWRSWGETVPLAFSGTVLLYAGWFITFYRPARLGDAALGLLLFTGLFALGPVRRRGVLVPAMAFAALVFGGLTALVIAVETDRPAALLGLLLAYSLLATAARPRWSGAEALGVSAGGLACLSWLAAFFSRGREAEACLLAVPLAGYFLVMLVVRGLVRRRRLGLPDLLCHAASAAFLWAVLFRAFYETRPSLLGGLSVALAAVYLVLGLAALRETPEDALQVRTTLGLAAVFLTLAIPVQLGLHGITLAWAAEGVVLLALGLRFESGRARLGAYGVLALAVLRLFVRHLPLHPSSAAFQPVLNPGFGTWLFVILALAAAAILLRRGGDGLAGGEQAVAGLVWAVALVLLFGLLTGETQAAFQERLRVARTLGDAAAARYARLTGGLALSVLWTVFATALLAAGLGFRNRPLFYTAYGLFAVTAAKVVLWDLATLETVYRIGSFLALGVLLMAGAYLNIRFRERLLPRRGEA